MAANNAAPPMLLFLVGPPAVGKMAVGQAIADRTGLRLFHNHIAIEVALRYFDFGTPGFSRIDAAIRHRIVEEVAASDLPGLAFTYVWDFDDPAEQEAVDAYAQPFRDRGGRVLFLELQAALSERLVRNEGASRLAEKPSKRDLPASRRRLIELDERHRLNSAGTFDGREDYLRIDNTALTPDEVAVHVIDHFSLPLRPRPDQG